VQTDSFPSTPRGSAGKAGCEERFEVEEPFPACQPKCPGVHGQDFLTSEEDIRMIYPRELDHPLKVKRSAVLSSTPCDRASGMA
jgi:hypothetical protein